MPAPAAAALEAPSVAPATVAAAASFKALLPDLAAKLDPWKEEREGVRAELEALRAEAGPEDYAERVDKALAQLARLRDDFDSPDAARPREVVRQMVAKIECWFDYLPHGTDRHGKPRMKSVLTRGVIYLRRDLFISRDVPSGSPLGTSLGTLLAIPFGREDLAA
jgi:hypothetical protein